MRRHWGRIAGGRRAYRISFHVETLEERLALSHAPLMLDAPEPVPATVSQEIGPVERASISAPATNRWGAALMPRSPDQLAASVAPGAPTSVRLMIAEQASTFATDSPLLALRPLPADRPMLALPFSGVGATSEDVVSLGRLPDSFSSVVSFARIDGEAGWTHEGGERPWLALSVGAYFSHVRTDDAKFLDSLHEFTLPFARFRPEVSEARGAYSFVLQQERTSAVEAEPVDTAPEVPIFATGVVDTRAGAVALPGSAPFRQASALAGSPNSAASGSGHVLIAPAAPLRFADGEIAETETLETWTPHDAVGSARLRAVRALPAEMSIAAAVTSGRELLSEVYDVQLGFAPTAMLDAVLMHSVALNSAVLQRALDDVMHEVEDLGTDLVSWIDDVRSYQWTVVAAATVTGAGWLLARRLRAPRSSDEVLVADSSTWLFARLQDPVGS